jgi:hypothetical protein
VSPSLFNNSEIVKNLEIKNEIIEKQERIAGGDFCKACLHKKSKLLGGITCELTGEIVDGEFFFEKFERR